MRRAGRDESRQGHTPRWRRRERDPRLRRAPAGLIREPPPQAQVLHRRPALWLPSPQLLETLRRRWQVVLDGGEQRVWELDLVQEGLRLQRPSKLRKGELPLVWL